MDNNSTKLKGILNEGSKLNESINHKDILREIDKFIDGLEDVNPVHYYGEVSDLITQLKRKISKSEQILQGN